MRLILMLSLMLCNSLVQAEVVRSGPDHYTLRQEASSTLAPAQLWQRLIQPQTWWHPDHTYSGKAENLRLEPQAGGTWSEHWDGNSVIHGTVINVQTNHLLRLDAPFGPLQQAAIHVVWSITISPQGDGSKVVFDEVAVGSSASDLAQLAKAVDYVKTEAITRLVTLPTE